MDMKKKLILAPLCFLIGVFLAIYLPQNLKALAILMGLVYWLINYTWTNFENKRKKNNY
jgi:xanthine/uracil permease